MKNSSYDKKLQEAKSLLDRGRHQEAFDVFDSLRKQYPDKAKPVAGVGACLYAMKERTQALGCFIKASELAPEDAEHFVNMGHCLRALDQPRMAIKQFEKALKLESDNFQALSELGRLYYDRHRMIEAINVLEKAIAIKPSDSANHAQIALTLANTGNYEDSVKHAEKAIRLEPNKQYGYYVMGNIQILFGNQEEAEKYFNKAIDIDPLYAVAYYAKTTRKMTAKDQAFINKMEKALSKGMPAADRQSFMYALGKSYNDLQQTDKAFEYVHKANELGNPEFDSKEHMRETNKQKKIFSKQFFKRRQFQTTTAYTPIFIVGMPRSGSTLLDQILSAHSSVFSGGESFAMGDIISEIKDDATDGKEYPDVLNEIDSKNLEKYRTSYIQKIVRGVDNITHIVDKNLFNYMNLGLIAVLFPNAKIIHTRRHPLDNALSCYMTGFTSGLGWTNNLQFIGKYYRTYLDLMNYWHRTLPLSILNMKYEDMVEDPETNVRRLLKFCDLEWEDQCLDFHKSKRHVNTASIWQVRQPVYKSSVQRWVPYAKHLQPLILALGDILEADYEKLESLGLKHGPRHNNPINKISKLFK